MKRLAITHGEEAGKWFDVHTSMLWQQNEHNPDKPANLYHTIGGAWVKEWHGVTGSFREVITEAEAAKWFVLSGHELPESMEHYYDKLELK